MQAFPPDLWIDPAEEGLDRDVVALTLRQLHALVGCQHEIAAMGVEVVGVGDPPVGVELAEGGKGLVPQALFLPSRVRVHLRRAASLDLLPHAVGVVADRDKMLRRYTELRLKSYELMYRGLKEQTDAYDAELATYANQTDSVLKILNKG